MTEPDRDHPFQMWAHCPRIDGPKPSSEHLACPYCFGTVLDVGTGETKRFCDFKKGVDPIAFGFPTGSSREDG